jgi:hypothetical protein
MTLTHHADGNVAGQLTGAVEFYAGIVSASIASGYSVALFSNGAAEDAALLQKVVNDPSIRGLEDVIVPKQPTTPRELAHVIAGCSAVIAHRLHACIVAYSYQRPVVGLGQQIAIVLHFGEHAHIVFGCAELGCSGNCGNGYGYIRRRRFDQRPRPNVGRCLGWH